MPCLVGMTLQPSRMKRDFEGMYPQLRNWQILERFSTKSAAREAEKRYAAQYSDNSRAGGAGPEEGNWVVYKFDY